MSQSTDEDYVQREDSEDDGSGSEKESKKRKAKYTKGGTKKLKGATFKKLDTSGKNTVKTKAKQKIVEMPDPVLFLPTPLTVKVKHLYRLSPIATTPFPDPAGAPAVQAAGYWMGGQSLQVRLGPRYNGEVRGDAKTYGKPYALADAKTNHPALKFVSGHILNGEMGGNGNDVEHVTILSHNANMAQKGFDQRIKAAQHALHQFYTYLGGLSPVGGQNFIDALDYGIDIDIQLVGGTLGPNYPENCVSSQMTFTAAVANEPNLATWLVVANFQRIPPSAGTFLAARIAEVQTAVNGANGFVVINP